MTLVEVMIAFAVFAIAIVGSLGAIIFSLNTVDSARATAQVTQILVNEMEAMRMRRWSVDRDVGNGSLTLLGVSTLAVSKGVTGSGSSQEKDAARVDVTFSNLPADVKAAVNGYIFPPTVNPGPGPMEITVAPTSMCASRFYPFAVYGVTSSSSGIPVSRVGKEVLPTAIIQLRDSDFANTAAVSVENSKLLRYVAIIPANANKSNLPAALVVLRVSWTDKRGDHSRVLSTIILSNGINEQIYRF